MNKAPKREGDFIGQGDLGGAFGEDNMWELENQKREAYLALFESSKFWEPNF